MIRFPSQDRIFWAGVVLRILALALALPFWMSSPTAAFLGQSFSGYLSPWFGWLIADGAPEAFGSGFPALIAFGPASWIGALVGAPWLGLAVSVLALDMLVYILLSCVAQDERRREVLRLYWLSPAVVFLIYWTDNLAVLPAALLLGSFIAIDGKRFALAGLFCGLAIAAEPVLAFLAPAFILYAVSIRRIRDGAGSFLVALGAAVAVPTLICMPDPAFREMVLRSPAMQDAFALALPFGDFGGIAILPLVVAGLGYMAWRARYIDAALLWTFVGLSLLALVLLGGIPASVAPVTLLFLTVHSAYAERSGRALYHAFAGLFLLWFALFYPTPLSPDGLVHDDMWVPLFQTLICATGMVIGIQMLHRGLFRSPSYLATRRPVAIGVAGDSGVGKDTLIDSVAAMFEPRVVAGVSGDDYHHWDRNKPMWRALTHLNPKANDLGLFAAHVTALIDRRWVMARHYDHSKGRMTKPLLIRPGELVLASGLHALWSPTLNGLYDLRIFLDMDEELRCFLKIRRDVHERGQPMERVLASIKRRREDAESFILPQRDSADLIFKLEPRNHAAFEGAQGIQDVPLRLAVRAIPGMTFDALVRVVVARCGIQAVELPLHAGGSQLIVEGDPDAADIAAAARALAPNIQTQLRDEPDWQSGLRGVMQLIILDQLEQIRHRRSLNA